MPIKDPVDNKKAALAIGAFFLLVIVPLQCIVNPTKKAGINPPVTLTPVFLATSAPAAVSPTIPPTIIRVAPAQPSQGSQVWANGESRIFHRPGSQWYGKTKDGHYMAESAALAAGYRESKR